MLIDFRVRPPYKTNLTTSLYNKPAPSNCSCRKWTRPKPNAP